MNISITPHKNGDGGIACMPLRQNIPEPKNEDWKLTNCPVCGRECWETDSLRQMLKDEPDVKAACTECALRAGTRVERSKTNDYKY